MGAGEGRPRSSTIAIATFSVWRLVKDKLLSDNMDVKEQVVKAKDAFEKAQDQESVRSLQLLMFLPLSPLPPLQGMRMRNAKNFNSRRVSSN